MFEGGSMTALNKVYRRRKMEVIKYQLISTKVPHYNDDFVIKEWDISKYNKNNILRSDMLSYVDMLLESFGKKSMSAELNDLQIAFSVKSDNIKGTCFEYKHLIPFDFWNLVLRVYGLKIRKEEIIKEP